MGSFSIWHWLVVLAVILILFGGGGKIPRLMGDFAKGIKSFKSGLKEEKEEKGDGEAAEDESREALGSEAAAEAKPAKRKKTAKA